VQDLASRSCSCSLGSDTQQCANYCTTASPCFDRDGGAPAPARRRARSLWEGGDWPRQGCHAVARRARGTPAVGCRHQTAGGSGLGAGCFGSPPGHGRTTDGRKEAEIDPTEIDRVIGGGPCIGKGNSASRALLHREPAPGRGRRPAALAGHSLITAPPRCQPPGATHPRPSWGTASPPGFGPRCARRRWKRTCPATSAPRAPRPPPR